LQAATRHPDQRDLGMAGDQPVKAHARLVTAGQEGAVQIGGQYQPARRPGVRACRESAAGNIGHRILRFQWISFFWVDEGTGDSDSGSSSSAVGVVRNIGWNWAGLSGAR